MSEKQNLAIQIVESLTRRFRIIGLALALVILVLPITLTGYLDKSPTINIPQLLTTRVSVGLSGKEANGYSAHSVISSDGRYVAFNSSANNLIAADTNGAMDVFVFDRVTGITELISVTPSGHPGDGVSYGPSISDDGRFVSFSSSANDLVAGDDFLLDDVFVRDRQTDTTKLVSVASDGTQGNNTSVNLSISADGRYEVFSSKADNLVPGDTNRCFYASCPDVFVHDLITGETIRVSVASDGTQANDVSGDGYISADNRYVLFDSSASNLVSGDTNQSTDVFLHDLVTGVTERISVTESGAQANAGSYIFGDGSMSYDSRYIVFDSVASNLVASDLNEYDDVFLYDRQLKTVERISTALDGSPQGPNGESDASTISADGRFIAFRSDADNIVPNDTNWYRDVFVHDRLFRQTYRITLSPSGGQANGNSAASFLDISADGCCITYESNATNLVIGDTSHMIEDVFVTEQVGILTPTLSINYTSGSPGSYFNLTGEGFSEGQTAAISVNGHHLGEISVPSGGKFHFTLITANADPGIYRVTVDDTPYLSVKLSLGSRFPLRPHIGDYTEFDIPPGIAEHEFYLAMIKKE